MPFSSGKYYPDINAGNVFIGSTAAAGVVPPAYNATAHTFCVWNPLGSNKAIIPISLELGFVSTTGAPGNVVLSYQTGVGSQVGTGSPITAATLVAPVNAKLGSGNASVAKFAPATITFASATSLLATTGISQLTTTGATTSAPMFPCEELFDGKLMIMPGTAVCVAGNVSLTTVFDITLWWEEIIVTIP